MPTYYEILGVSNDASETDIKKAYRKLSLQYHPDRNSSEEAVQKIQEVNQAYEILSDTSSKQQYDHELQFGGGGGGGMGGHQFNHMNEFNDLNNIFNMMFGSNGGGFPGMNGFQNMGGPNIRVFHNGVQVNHPMIVHKPEVLCKTIQIDLQNAYSGVKVPLDIDRIIIKNGVQTNEKETIYLDIDKGIEHNDVVQFLNKGHIVNDLNGDVRITIEVINNTCFQRNGLDLIYKKTISLKESLCGFTFEINHLNGKRLCLNNKNNPSVIKPNFQKIVPNMGMVKNGATGNMLIEFNVEFPETLTVEQIKGILDIL
jgi:DnaJ-class molecular chaperone